MAKKKQQEVVEEPQIQKEVIEQPQIRERKKPANEWEIKDRLYHLLKGKTLSRMIKAADIYWFDEEK